MDRLKSEAQTFGWLAVRAHALEWFDSLPARAFEKHSLVPMSLSLLPKRAQDGVSIIKNTSLYTTSPLVHEWALNHRYFVSYLSDSFSETFSVSLLETLSPHPPPCTTSTTGTTAHLLFLTFKSKNGPPSAVLGSGACIFSR